jgi:hypothetical protein
MSNQQLQALFTALETGKSAGMKLWIRRYRSSSKTDDFNRMVFQMYGKNKVEDYVLQCDANART